LLLSEDPFGGGAEKTHLVFEYCQFLRLLI